MLNGVRRRSQLRDAVQEACAELGRSPYEVTNVLDVLGQEWIEDIETLAGLSNSRWRDLNIPAALKEALKRHCEERFDSRMARPIGNGLSTHASPSFSTYTTPLTGQRPSRPRSAGVIGRSQPSWQNTSRQFGADTTWDNRSYNKDYSSSPWQKTGPKYESMATVDRSWDKIMQSRDYSSLYQTDRRRGLIDSNFLHPNDRRATTQAATDWTTKIGGVAGALGYHADGVTRRGQAVFDMQRAPLETQGFSGKAVQLLKAVRDKLQWSGGGSAQGISQICQIADRNNDGCIDRAEFEGLIRKLRVAAFEDPQNIQTLWEAFDIDRAGAISYDQFFRTIRGRMNDKREAAVCTVFECLDRDCDGLVDRWELVMNFDPCPQALGSGLPLVEVMATFMSIGVAGDQSWVENRPMNIQISLDLFCAYYDDVSVRIDRDYDFVAMVERTWFQALRGRAPKSVAWQTQYQRALSNVNTVWNHGRDQRNQDQENIPTDSHCAAATLLRMRHLLLQRFPRGSGRGGARQLARMMWELTHSGSQASGVHEVSQAMFGQWVSQLGHTMSDVDRQILFFAIGDDGSGFINTEALFKALRGDMYASVRRDQRAGSYASMPPETRAALVNDVFDRVAGCVGARTIQWGQAKLPQEILDLLVGMPTCGDALSRQDFVDYYLNCGMLLESDREFEDLLSQDWPDAAVSGVYNRAQQLSVSTLTRSSTLPGRIDARTNIGIANIPHAGVASIPQSRQPSGTTPFSIQSTLHNRGPLTPAAMECRRIAYSGRRPF